jgi:putative sterol carrier protein
LHDDPVIVYWDYAGIASLAEEGNNIKANRFSATLNNWKAFINGSFTAPVGVMTGKILDVVFKASNTAYQSILKQRKIWSLKVHQKHAFLCRQVHK